MTDSDDSPPLWFRFLRDRLLSIFFIITLLTAFALLYFSPSFPREFRIFGLAFIVLLPYGWLVGSWLTSLIQSPRYIYLVDLDAQEIDGGLYRFTDSSFREMETVNGDITQATPNLYFGKNVDLKKQTVEGTWRGTMDDRDLARSLQKVAECRGQLEADARRGFIIETQAFTIIRTCVRSATLSIVRTFEKGTLPEDNIADAIDEALDHYDLDETLEEATKSNAPEEQLNKPSPSVDLPDDPTQQEVAADD